MDLEDFFINFGKNLYISIKKKSMRKKLNLILKNNLKKLNKLPNLKIKIVFKNFKLNFHYSIPVAGFFPYKNVK